jgi:hypothetical protein
MDDTYKEFIVEGGLVYPERADNLQVLSGVYSATIVWKKATDPKVVRARIYWDNYSDSTEVDTSTADKFVRVSISDLKEKHYTFQIITMDAEGNKSLPSEVSGDVYGDTFLATLKTRPVLYEIANSVTGEWTLKWDAAAVNTIATEVEYTTTGGGVKTVTVPVADTKTVIPDARFGATYRYRTVFSLALSAEYLYTGYTSDVVSSKYEEVKIPSTRFANAALPTDTYTANGDEAYNGLGNLWDGLGWQNLGSGWGNTFYSDPGTNIPSHFTINLGQTVILDRFKMYPHRTGRYAARTPRVFEVWGTENPPADGSFDNWTKIGLWEVHKPSGYNPNGAVGTITAEDLTYIQNGADFTVEADRRIPIKYLRFKTLSTFETYGTATTQAGVQIAELEFWGGIFD